MHATNNFNIATTDLAGDNVLLVRELKNSSEPHTIMQLARPETRLEGHLLNRGAQQGHYSSCADIELQYQFLQYLHDLLWLSLYCTVLTIILTMIAPTTGLGLAYSTRQPINQNQL